MQIFRARLASFGHLGLISDPLIESKFQDETHNSIGQENKIYTIVKAGRRSTAATQSQSPAVVKSDMLLIIILWKQRMLQQTETRVCKFFWARLASFGLEEVKSVLSSHP